MLKDVKEILRFLFPEYQIKANVDERGFIAKGKPKTNYAQSQVQTHLQENIKQHSAPSSGSVAQPIQNTATTPAISPHFQAPQKAYSPEKPDAKTVSKVPDAFYGLSDVLKKYWIGSETDRLAICKAYLRPYVRGFDNKKPKNTILLIGSESRGKIYAIKCINMLLKQKKIFRYAEIATVDFRDYPVDSTNALFLSDLYKALNIKTETIVFENVDKASLPQLEIIYQLLAEGYYKLPKRYMMDNSSLVEATGVLNTELVSEIKTNGKYFILTTTMSQAKIISLLGNNIVKELGDIIVLDPIADNQVGDLTSMLCMNLVQKCKENLHIQIEFDESLINELKTHYRPSLGVKGFAEYIEKQLYEPLSEMKLQRKLRDDENASLIYNYGYCAVLQGSEVIQISEFLKKYNAVEIEDARKELDQIIGLAKVKAYECLLLGTL